MKQYGRHKQSFMEDNVHAGPHSPRRGGMSGERWKWYAYISNILVAGLKLENTQERPFTLMLDCNIKQPMLSGAHTESIIKLKAYPSLSVVDRCFAYIATRLIRGDETLLLLRES